MLRHSVPTQKLAEAVGRMANPTYPLYLRKSLSENHEGHPEHEDFGVLSPPRPRRERLAAWRAEKPPWPRRERLAAWRAEALGAEGSGRSRFPAFLCVLRVLCGRFFRL
ncbi:hypothetical protein, partial [Thermogutta sp.]|uniref:hypothetical protein n=1 Tax=Thermogutta sp. TaxID=1962930 RepID=UPI0032202391